jgi:hypothetical protein
MSQVDRIHAHLKSSPITSMQALRRYGCFRLAARIRDLRASGHQIETERVERGGKTFARYRMG